MLLALLLLSAATHANVGFGTAPEVEGRPGEYVTFAIPVSGSGDVTVSITGPAGWKFVSQERRLTLNGLTLVPFTLHVPVTALAGTSANLVALAQGASGELFSTTVNVTVAGSTGTGMIEAGELQAPPGQELSFKVTVTNEANQPDTILLSASNASRQVLVSPDRLELGPFQSGTVNVTVPVQGRTNNGYGFTIALSAWSRIADATTVRHIRASYVEGGSTVPLSEREPQLTLSITAGARAGLESTDGEVDPIFNWSITPALSGELSDYVDLQIRTGSFRNTAESPFTVPGNTSIELSGQDWDAALNVGPRRFRVGGSIQAADWRFSVSSNFMRFVDSTLFGLSAFASSLDPELDLQFSGNLFITGDLHSESFSVHYRRRLTGNLSFGAGVGLTGMSIPDTGDYRLIAVVSQSLSWNTPTFSLTQAVQTSPGLGLTNISLLGSSRTAHPLGIRFSSRLSLSAELNRLANTVQLISQLNPALRLSAGITHQTSNFGAGPGQLRLQFGVAWRFGSNSLRLEAATVRALDENTQSANRFRVSFTSSLRRLSIILGLSGEQRAASLVAEASSTLRFDSTATYRIGDSTILEAQLNLERSQRSGYRFSVRWQQRWSHVIHTDLGVVLSERGQEYALGLSAHGVFTEGLNMGIGYGLVHSSGLVTHRFTAGISYTWRIPFNTPQPVVNLFGGRLTGSIAGTAFLDSNLNHHLDPGEAPLAGIVIQAGDYSTVSAEDGSFTLRLASGHHQLEFAGNLPATLGFMGTNEVTVRLDENQSLDLPFAAVSMLKLSVFLDGDRDGERTADEPLLPGIVVNIGGPLNRRVVTGADGSSWVSGLIQGAYRLDVDFGSLPAGYDLTAPTGILQVEPPAHAGPVHVPVAPRIRDVVTTFAANSLAVSATVSHSSIQAGNYIRVIANVSGQADTVSVELFGQRVALEYDGVRWIGTITVPESPGLQRGFVEAINATGSSRADIQVLVTTPD